MWWMTIGKIIGGILTLVILYLLIKELKESIKKSKDGHTSNKCELD